MKKNIIFERFKAFETNKGIRKLWGIVVIICLVVCFLLRVLFPERSIQYVGPRAIFDAIFTMGLILLILIISGGVGLKILSRLCTETNFTLLEKVIFSLSLGLGVNSCGVLLLGLVGVLSPFYIAMWLLLETIWSSGHVWKIFSQLPSHFFDLLKAIKSLNYGEKGFLIVGGTIYLMGLFHTLAPPVAYDALMYHLHAPKIFLDAGRILLLPDIYQANSPFSIEMLFTIGLAFGTDTFAGVLDLTFSFLLILSSFSFTQRILGTKSAWFVVAILISIPIFPIWGTLANVDMAWSFYELVTIYAVIIWTIDGKQELLVISGLLMGFAISSKILGLGLLTIMGIWVLWRSWRDNYKHYLINGLIFGFVSILIVSPWFVKNYFWTKNPFYPFFFGGPGWNATRLEQLMLITRSYGPGQSLIDYLILPWNLYRHYSTFATMKFEIPSPLFLLALFYPCTRVNRLTDWVFVIMGLRFFTWSLTTHATRYLLPVFPLLAMIAVAVMTYIYRRYFRRVNAYLIGWIILGELLLLSLIYQGIVLLQVSPHLVVLGHESKETFLSRVLDGYDIIQYVRNELPEETIVYMMWDGKGYYCGKYCLQDSEQSQWTTLSVDANYDTNQVVSRLRALGVTHLLIDTDLMKFILDHDPYGYHSSSYNFFTLDFGPRCTTKIKENGIVSLYELTCH